MNSVAGVQKAKYFFLKNKKHQIGPYRFKYAMRQVKSLKKIYRDVPCTHAQENNFSCFAIHKLEKRI